MNARVRLREPNGNDVPLLDLWDSTPEYRGEFNDFGAPPKSHAERLEKGFIGATNGTLIIETLEGAPVGTVDWRPAVYGLPPESIAAQLGITLAPEARGKGYGPEALRLIADYLFVNTKTNRIEGSCDVENVASQKALTKAGYRFEGIARGAQFRRGAYHDLMLYGLTRAGFEQPARAFSGERKPPVEVRIRPYEPTDQPRVQWLFERTPPWGRTYPRPQPLPEELERPDVSFPGGCFVALGDDIAGEALVGFLAVAPAGDDEELPEFIAPHAARGRVHWCSVAPERWRLGIGRQLMQAGIARLHELRCESIILETTATQEGAQALYASLGFVERGRTQLHIWTQVWMELV